MASLFVYERSRVGSTDWCDGLRVYLADQIRRWLFRHICPSHLCSMRLSAVGKVRQACTVCPIFQSWSLYSKRSDGKKCWTRFDVSHNFLIGPNCCITAPILPTYEIMSQDADVSSCVIMSCSCQTLSRDCHHNNSTPPASKWHSLEGSLLNSW